MDLCSIITICKTIQNKCIFPNFNYKRTENNQCRAIAKSLLNNIYKNFCQRAKICQKSLIYNMKVKSQRIGLMRSCFHHCNYLKLHGEVTFKTTNILKTQINVSVKYICYCPFRDMAVNKKSELKLQITEVLDLAKHKIFIWFLPLYTVIKCC